MKLLSIPFLLIGLLLSSASLTASEVRGVWRGIAPLPSARQEVAVASLGKDVYVIGGLVPGGATNGVAVYDAEAGTWAEAPALPRVLHHAGAAAVNGRIYSIGGFLGTSFGPINSVSEFDPQLQRWRDLPPLPEPRGALAVAVIEGDIYAAGGTGFGGDSGSLFRFDPDTANWETLAPMPTSRNHHAAATLDGRLYVVGGRRLGGNISSLEIFDPATGLWEAGPPLPTARSGIAAVAAHGLMFVLGGEIPGVFDEVEVFDPESNRWFSLTPMAIPRHGIGAAVYQNRIIIPGGAVREGLGATTLSDEFVVLENVTVLAQFADSPEIVSQLLASNFGTEPVEALAEVRGDDGGLLPILPNGGLSAQIAFTLQPGQTRVLTTPGGTLPAAVGYALLFSDRPLLAHVLFSSNFGFAGVLGQTPLREFGVPVSRSVESRLNSGVALASLSPEACGISLSLLNSAGVEIAAAQVLLAALGHEARLIDQLFPGVDIREFQGSVTGAADCEFGAMAILLRGNQMATLPVQGKP